MTFECKVKNCAGEAYTECVPQSSRLASIAANHNRHQHRYNWDQHHNHQLTLSARVRDERKPAQSKIRELILKARVRQELRMA